MSLKYQEIVTITGVCINCNTRVADIFIPSRFMAASTHPDAWLNQKYMLKIPCSNCGHEYAKCTGSIRIAIKPLTCSTHENYTANSYLYYLQTCIPKHNGVKSIIRQA